MYIQFTYRRTITTFRIYKSMGVPHSQTSVHFFFIPCDIVLERKSILTELSMFYSECYFLKKGLEKLFIWYKSSDTVSRFHLFTYKVHLKIIKVLHEGIGAPKYWTFNSLGVITPTTRRFITHKNSKMLVGLASVVDRNVLSLRLCKEVFGHADVGCISWHLVKPRMHSFPLGKTEHLDTAKVIAFFIKQFVKWVSSWQSQLNCPAGDFTQGLPSSKC